MHRHKQVSVTQTVNPTTEVRNKYSKDFETWKLNDVTSKNAHWLVLKKRESSHCCMNPIRPPWQEENEKRGLFRKHIVHLLYKSHYTEVAPEKNKGFWLKLYNLSLMVGFTWPDSEHLQLWTTDNLVWHFFIFLLRLWLQNWVLRMHVSPVATVQSVNYICKCVWWMHFNFVGIWCFLCHFEKENEKHCLLRFCLQKGNGLTYPFYPFQVGVLHHKRVVYIINW